MKDFKTVRKCFVTVTNGHRNNDYYFWTKSFAQAKRLCGDKLEWCPERDVVIYNGHEMERLRAKYLDIIAKNEHFVYCYIRKGKAYYRPNKTGYTFYPYEAGVYLKSEAIADAADCEDLVLERIDVDEHNMRIDAMIAELNRNKIIDTESN